MISVSQVNYARQLYFTGTVSFWTTPYHGRATCACPKENRNWRGIYTFSPLYNHEPIEETPCRTWQLQNFDRETELETFFLLRLDFVPDLIVEDDYERRDNPYRTYIPGTIGNRYEMFAQHGEAQTFPML